MLIEKRSGKSGMDGDTNARELSPDTVLNLMNARWGISEYGRSERWENILGTTQTTNNNIPPYGTNKCIGSCVDEARGYILFFLWNTFADHGIYCYDIANNITYGVLYDSQVTGTLNFSKSYRIDRNCKVVGDMLYWTDNNNPPRRINYIAAIKTNHSSFSTSVTPYTNPLSQSVISWIRRPYGLATTATKSVDGGFAQNFLTDFSGEFATAFVYRDGEPSVPSTPSNFINYNLSTDTFNRVQVVYPFAETFDQDVQIIQLLVRYGNDPDYFIIKEWNKANATDLAEINAHNAGSTNLTYNFYNNKTGIPFGQANSVKPSDSIGITVKTIEFATNRMFQANYVKGYGTPVTTSLTGTLSTSGSDPVAATSLKVFSSWQIGIRFRDNSKRSSFVVTNSSCIVTSADRSYTTLPYSSISWALSNLAATVEIPDWAYYYDIVITKNLRTRFFIHYIGSNIQYAKKQADGTYIYQTTYDGLVYALAIDLQYLNNAGVGYLFQEGDLCRVYLSNTATVYEFNVLGQDGNNLLVQAANLGTLNPQPGFIFEIYTPYKASENETFYTIGQSYKITNPTTGSRVYSTTSGTIAGDITRYQWLFSIRLEAMSPNYKLWQDWFQIYGEQNVQSLLGQVSKTNFLSWSNVKIIGAQTSGLSTFDALDEKALPLEDGSIQKLQLANKVSDQGQGNILLAICSTEVASIYLGATEVFGSSKTVYVAQSTDVAGSVNTLTGSLGTANPESIVQYLGLVFGYDVNNGCWWQYSANGLEPISKYGMTRFFQRYSQGYLAANANNLDNINGFHHIPSGINPFTKELMCTMPGLIYSNYAATLPSYSSIPSYATSIINRFDIYDSLAKTMCFKFEENNWNNNIEAMPEWMETVNNVMYGFKNGTMWSFNTNTTNWNTFFGTQYPVRICITANLNSSLMRVLNNIAIEGDGTTPNFVVALTAVPNQQITDLASTDTQWATNESVVEAAFLADRLSPNSSIGGTADQKLFTGDPLRDFCIFVMAEYQAYTGLIFINGINIGYDLSKGMQNIVNVINK